MAGPMQILELVTRAHSGAGTEPFVKKSFNVWHFIRDTALGTPNKAHIITAFQSTIQSAQFTCVSVNYIMDFITARWLDDPLDPETVVVDAGTGAVTGDSLPSVNNVCVRLKCGIRGRNYIGRKHFGPIAESSTLLDALNAGAITDFNALQATIEAGFTDSDGFNWSTIVVSKLLSDFTLPLPTIVYGQVTETVLDVELGIMRRRKQPS